MVDVSALWCLGCRGAWYVCEENPGQNMECVADKSMGSERFVCREKSERANGLIANIAAILGIRHASRVLGS